MQENNRKRCPVTGETVSANCSACGLPECQPLSLIIKNLTLKEIKGLLKHVRAIESKDPSRVIMCFIGGLEFKSLEETKKIVQEIFPPKGVAA